MNKRNTFVILGISALASLFINLGMQENVQAWSAYTCRTWWSVNDVSPKAYNSFADTDQADFACNSDSTSGSPHGAMFITGTPVTTSGAITVNSIVEPDGSATQNFYLTGGFYSRSGGSGYYVFGSQVSIATWNNSTSEYENQGIASVSNLNYYNGSVSINWGSTYQWVGNYVYRGYLKAADKWVLGTSYPLTVNRDAFYDTSKPGLYPQGSDLVYRWIGVYRCWVQSSSSSTIDSSAVASDSCGWQDIKIYGRKKPDKTTFDGSVDAWAYVDGQWKTGTSSNPIKIDDTSSKSLYFRHYIRRNNNGPDAAVANTWHTTVQSKGTAKGDTTTNFNKNSDWVTVHNDDSGSTGTLTRGQNNEFCQTLYYSAESTDGTQSSPKTTRQGCVYIYPYRWDSWDGRVVATASGGTSGEDKNGIYYTDSNSAKLKFEHQLKRSDGNKQTRYKTTKDNTLSSTFTTQNNYTNSNVSSNNWTTVYNSPSSAANVTVAKDDGSTYCETLYWYKDTREDRANTDTGQSKIKNESSANGCKTFKRYKTTFTGTIKVEYQKPGETTWNTVYTAGSSEINPGTTSFKEIDISGEAIPTDVKVRFTHTVKRSNNDAEGSPNKKKSYFTTNLDGTTGYRAGDPHGTAISNVETKELAKNEYDTYVDEFTVKIYPEQEITLCQKLSYKSEIQGADATATGNAGRRCFRLTKKKVSCQGIEYGVKTARNYLTMEIYKNSTLRGTSGRLDQSADKEVTVWAKPGDSVRYKYTMCAAGELASQFADKYITTYSVGTDKAGYLFGKTLSSSPYTATTKVVGTSSNTPGEGPFPNGTTESHKYEYTTNSPSNNADDLYKCGDNGVSDYYTIPAIRPNDPNFNTLKNNCASAKVGETSDVGKSFTQTAYWTDIWYENGVAQDGHKGDKTATVTGRINVPYNYVTEVSTGAAGGNVVLGQSIKAKVSLKIGKRQNELVNDTTAYTTYSKPTKYRLVQITVSPGSNLAARTYRDEIAAQEYGIMDNNGNQDTLLGALSRCSWYSDRNVNCSIVRGRDTGTTYYPGDNTARDIEGSSITVNINDDGSNYAVGTKICFVAAVWPSDSHGIVNTNITKDDNQDEALRDTGSRWHLSRLSCFTVAKRPSMASLGSDVYAPAGILGATTKRSYDRLNNKALFGSWSEYGLVSGTIKNASAGEIKGVASGASLWGGGAVSNITRTCYFSSMTFANAECADEKLGQVPINTASSSYPKNLADQIRTRYTDINNAAAKTSASKISVGGVCVYDPNSNTYNESYSDSNSKFICLPNGAKYTHATADLTYIEDGVEFCMVKGDTYNSRTSVIQADKTLMIGTNMVYGSVHNTDRAGTVSGTGCYKQSYDTISEIPQLIIIADKIVIKQNVKHIDAWLIANEIYTCDPRSGYNAINQNNNKLDNNAINAANCNEQLTITGPVITQKLNLFRTGGGDNYTNNGMPAEIFYLGPESYLWSYNQAQRFSQATTTYQRELPPRY